MGRYSIVVSFFLTICSYSLVVALTLSRVGGDDAFDGHYTPTNIESQGRRPRGAIGGAIQNIFGRGPTVRVERISEPLTDGIERSDDDLEAAHSDIDFDLTRSSDDYDDERQDSDVSATSIMIIQDDIEDDVCTPTPISMFPYTFCVNK